MTHYPPPRNDLDAGKVATAFFIMAGMIALLVVWVIYLTIR